MVVVVDAAALNLPPGSIQLLTGADMSGFTASTHSLPLNLFASYLTSELQCPVLFIAILNRKRKSFKNAFIPFGVFPCFLHDKTAADGVIRFSNYFSSNKCRKTNSIRMKTQKIPVKTNVFLPIEVDRIPCRQLQFT